MDDVDGPAVAAVIYKCLYEEDKVDPGDIPYALDDAVQALRQQGLSPSRWATYVHIGA
jgi:hypothetical protein